jgi:NMD protein affecting ribosome stability and mRNA decay
MSDTEATRCPSCGQQMRGSEWIDRLLAENARLREDLRRAQRPEEMPPERVGVPVELLKQVYAILENTGMPETAKRVKAYLPVTPMNKERP